MNRTLSWVPKCALAITFLASNSLHNDGGQKNHAHVTTQRILNKLIEINFYVGYMVWLWCCLFQHWRPLKYWWDLSVIKWARWKRPKVLLGEPPCRYARPIYIFKKTFSICQRNIIWLAFFWESFYFLENIIRLD